MPYYWHPISVAQNIEEVKQSRNLELLMTAAVLHDTVEDCPDVSIDDIARIFGYQVASLVDELTSDKKQIAKMGKTEYLKHKMANMTSYGLVIKLADRLHNIKDLENTSAAFQKSYTAETLAIINHLESCGTKLTQTHKKLLL
jgi:GTP pyrophosphokinase